MALPGDICAANSTSTFFSLKWRRYVHSSSELSTACLTICWLPRISSRSISCGDSCCHGSEAVRIDYGRQVWPERSPPHSPMVYVRPQGIHFWKTKEIR